MVTVWHLTPFTPELLKWIFLSLNWDTSTVTNKGVSQNITKTSLYIYTENFTTNKMEVFR